MKKPELKILLAFSFIVFSLLIVGGLQQRQILFKRAVEPIPGTAGDFTADKVFGQPDFKSNSPNQVVDNRVFHPQGFAIDRNILPNKIYIWDSGNHRILGLTAGREAADLVFGQPDFNRALCNGDNTQDLPNASASTLCSQVFGQKSLMESPQPNSMAVDNNHNLYAFDPYNHRVLKYNDPYSSDKTQGKGDTIADFVWGQPDFTSRQSNQGGALSNKTLSGGYGVGVDVDVQGNVWVTDVGNKRVLRFPPNGKEADLILGQSDFTTRNEAACNFCYKDEENINKGELASCQGPFAGTIPETALPSQQNFCMPKAVKVSSRTGQVFVLDWTFVVDRIYGTESNYFRVLIYNPNSTGQPFVSNQAPAEVIIGNGHRRFPASLGIPLYRTLSIEIDPSASDAFWLVGAASSKLAYIQKIAGAWRITKQLTDGLESPGGVALDVMGNVYTDTLHGGQEIKRFKAPIPTTCPTCSSYPSDIRILKSQDTAFASPNKVSGAGLRDPSNVLLTNYRNGQKQMLVADRSRVLIWNDYENKSSGSSADGVLFESDMETLSSAGQEILTMHKDGLDRIWLAGFSGEIFVFQGPVGSGQAPLKRIDATNLALRTGGTIQTGGIITGIVYNENENALWLADAQKHRLIRIANPLEENSKVDMVIGQPDNNSILANRGVDNDDDHSNPGWAACSHMVADGFGNISGLFYDNFKNLYVADGSREGWQCSNNRLLEFDRETLIPDSNKIFFQQGERIPKRVYGGSDFTDKNRYQDRDNIPYTPIAVAFNNKNEMLVTADGYSNNYQKRAFVFSNPLPACSTPCRVTSSIVLPIPGAQLSSPSFDKAGNLAVLDHTWNRVLYFSSFPSSPGLPTLIPSSPMPTVTIAPTGPPTITPASTNVFRYYEAEVNHLLRSFGTGYLVGPKGTEKDLAASSCKYIYGASANARYLELDFTISVVADYDVYFRAAAKSSFSKIEYFPNGGDIFNRIRTIPIEKHSFDWVKGTIAKDYLQTGGNILYVKLVPADLVWLDAVVISSTNNPRPTANSCRPLISSPTPSPIRPTSTPRPTLTPFPIFRPTIAPIPTSVSPTNPYCSGGGFYPHGPYQDKGADGNTDNLSNTYSTKYVHFTAPFTGKVNGLLIKAGNWGGSPRTVFCKVTGSNGTTDISQESSAADSFKNDSSARWRKIAFPTQFTLIGGEEYRLYCRGSDTSNMVYWIYDPTKDANNDMAKLIGRTYSICMQPDRCSVCDFTGDKKVCGNDIDLMGESCYGQPAAGDCARYDVNKDQRINILDFSYCATCVSRTCPVSPTPTPR